jgi:hypothetical protein
MHTATATATSNSDVLGLFGQVNDLARHTGWLHGPVQAYAAYGGVVFASLLLAGWWLARARGPLAMAAALWTGGAGSCSRSRSTSRS